MKNVVKALASARQLIKETKVKKLGHNSFSKYDYFTPDQIHQLCFDACNEVGLLSQFNLKRNELGVTGELILIDIESGETMTFEMASAIPEIKATNIAQQLGGAVTYTNRYLLMTAFDITDNSLDFDADKKAEKEPVQQPKKKELSHSQLKFACDRIKADDLGGLTRDEFISKLQETYIVTNIFLDQLNKA